MVDAEEVRIPFEVDDREVRIKFDEVDRRIKRTEETAKKSGKAMGSSFFGAAVGGAIGFAVGAAQNNPVVNSVLDLLINIIAAAILPIMVALLPLIVALTPILIKIGEVIAQLLSWLVTQFADNPFSDLAKPLTEEEREERAPGSSVPLPRGTQVIARPGGEASPYNPDESVRAWVGPIPVSVNRERLWGPVVIG